MQLKPNNPFLTDRRRHKDLTHGFCHVNKIRKIFFGFFSYFWVADRLLRFFATKRWTFLTFYDVIEIF